jgi:DNA-binding response OmpR family regulator
LKNRNILVADGEPKTLDDVSSYLECRGFSVRAAETGSLALELAESGSADLVVLGSALPDIPSEDVCLAIRRKSRVPVIMLAERIDDGAPLRWLRIGADDFVAKPFSLTELHARIETALRRAAASLAPAQPACAFRDGDLIVDLEKNVVMKRRVPVSLTPSELKILAALMRHPGKVFTRAELIDAALGDEFDGYDRAIDNHIKNLRQKLEDDSKNPSYILTLHGFGYKFGGG